MTDVSTRPAGGATGSAPAGRRSLLSIDGGGFSDAFARRPFPVGHALVDHPLLTLEGIAELADALPPSSIERHRADQPLLVPGGAEELDGRPSDTVRNIDTNNTWMVLWYVEQDPRWKRLLYDCLDEVEAHVRGRDGGMLQREGFLFLSAPNAVTPWHFDPEHNLLLQIRGTKEMNVGRFDDPADQLRELDRYHDGGHRNIEQAPGNVEPFLLEPGKGVYVPPFAPHWVRNGDAISISLSITFRTKRSQATERAHGLNARLRRLGLHPKPAGDDERKDRAKAAVWKGLDEVKRARGAVATRLGR
jgi:Cupin superfamily protein